MLKHLINTLSRKITQLEVTNTELEITQEELLSENKNHIQVRSLNMKLFDMYSDKIDDLEYLNNNLSDEVERKIQEILKTEKFSKIGEYSSRLAHDIRNPLAVISNSLEILELKNQINNQSSAELDRIHRSMNRIESLIKDTLDYVRDSTPVKKDTSIKLCFKNCIEFSQVKDNIEIKTPENDFVIQADPRKLEVVFGNLIKNAIESIGTEKGEINVDYLDKENDLIVTIQDSGPEISDLDKLFEPLYSTKPRGTGLGLASCKNIIESHDGTISASNNPKKFVITLPIAN
jgi:signal transduction histidine kinase